ncbi:MAG TPA: hypothetical protein VEM41_11920, partial [Actinomycetota bacterium]|nr:hypothetical protein [Actinomycetota bacterium]
MSDLRDRLGAAGRQAPPLSSDPLERLEGRRVRRARRGRVTAGAVSLVVATLAIAGVLAAFRPGTHPRTTHPAAGHDLSVGADQYAYEKTVTYSYGPEG